MSNDFVAGLRIGGSEKARFFNSAEVIRKLEKGKRRAFSKCGAFVRTVAKSSIKYRTKPSSPGQPPSARRGSMTRSHTNKKTGVTKTRSVSPLKELIFFAWDESKEAMVIGPARKKTNRPKYLVPHALEVGATVQKRLSGTLRPVKIAARPFMRPALDSQMPKFADTFKDILGG